MNEENNSSVVKHFLETIGIQKYLDQDITEIVINRIGEIGIEDNDGWNFFEEEGVTLKNLQHLTQALTTYNNLESASAKDPIKSMVLPNGERSQFIIPPACPDGQISITIRKPSLKRFKLSDYQETGRFDGAIYNEISAKDKEIEITKSQREIFELFLASQNSPEFLIDFIKKGVDMKMNFLIVGGTGSGKTTVAKAIADEYPTHRRIITIEDVHEMSLPYHNNKVHLFYKAGIIAPKYLIESAMRMKPDHLFLAELRGEEAWSYIEALNTGHEGSVSTIHANDTYSAFSRLASIVKQSSVGMTLEYDFILKTIKSSIDILLFFEKKRLKEVYFNPFEKNNILYGSGGLNA